MRRTYWEKIRQVMIERIRRKKIIDGLKEIEEKKRQYLRTKRLHSLSNLFKNFLKKEHPELIVKGKIKKNIRNQLHPTLEELLDSYQKKKEPVLTNEEINRRNKSIVRKVIDLFKKVLPVRRKLRNRFI